MACCYCPVFSSGLAVAFRNLCRIAAVSARVELPFGSNMLPGLPPMTPAVNNFSTDYSYRDIHRGLLVKIVGALVYYMPKF